MLFQPRQTTASSMALLPPSLLHVPVIQARIAVQCSYLSFSSTHKSLFISDFSHIIFPPHTHIINLHFQKEKVEPWLPLHSCTSLILFFLLYQSWSSSSVLKEKCALCGVAELLIVLNGGGGCSSS